MKYKLRRMLQDIPENCLSCAIFLKIENPLSNYFLVNGEFVRTEFDVDGDSCLYVKSIMERRLIDNKVFNNLHKCENYVCGESCVGFTKKNIDMIGYIMDYINLEFNRVPTLEILVEILISSDITREIGNGGWKREPLKEFVFAVPVGGEVDYYSSLLRICNEYKKCI